MNYKRLSQFDETIQAPVRSTLARWVREEAARRGWPMAELIRRALRVVRDNPALLDGGDGRNEN